MSLAAQVAAGQQGELALGLGGPKALALRPQFPWEWVLEGRPRVRVSPQEAGRPDAPAVQRAEGWAEVRALAIGSRGPSILEWGCSKVAGGSDVPDHCPALNDRRRP